MNDYIIEVAVCEINAERANEIVQLLVKELNYSSTPFSYVTLRESKRTPKQIFQLFLAKLYEMYSTIKENMLHG